MRWLLAALILVPVSVALDLTHANAGWLFLISCCALIPLAALMGVATEELVRRHGSAGGAVLNATFGNATELIIALVAARHNEVAIVKASLIGSIIGNVLLVLGLAVFLGGIRYNVQTFSPVAAQAQATMLTMAVISLLVPALFVRDVPGLNETALNPRIENLSLGVAGVLLALYVGSLLFSLRTHENLFAAPETGVRAAPVLSQQAAVLCLAACAAVAAYESSLLVLSIGPVVARWPVSKLFLGVIVVPIIGNAPEHASAIVMAVRNRLDVSLSIASASSTQIAMFVAPLVIFVSALMGHPITVLFGSAELIALTAAVLIAVLISMDGKSHWLEGAQLLATYTIVALAFYFVSR